MIYFSSDPHYGHFRILEYTGRPWSSVEEMNQGLIANWNARVTDDDTAYILGDFAMGKRSETVPAALSQLKGKIILVRGNHDSSAEKMKSWGFKEVYEELDLEINGVKFHLTHIPVPKKPEWDINLCGHVHQEFKRLGQHMINVGVDVRGFEPKTIQELLL